jgi:hypothetical protein
LQSIQSGGSPSNCKRKDDVCEDEFRRTGNLGGFFGLWWKPVGELINNGHNYQRLPASGMLSQFLKLSLISSLCLGSPWFTPIPALASLDASEASEQAFVSERKFSNVASVPFGLKGFEGEETIVEYNSCQSHTERLFNISEQTSAAQPKNYGTRAMFALAENCKSCEESYGFLPCSDSLGGNLALIAAYGYFLLLAAQFISNGSELLLEVGENRALHSYEI